MDLELTEQELLNSLRPSLTELNLGWAAETDFIREFYSDCVRYDYGPITDKGVSTFMLPSKRYVIRDEDLQFFPTLVSAVAPGVGALVFLAPPVAALSALLYGVATVIYRAWRKGAVVSPEEMRVLGILKANDGVTVDDIVDILRRAQAGVNRVFVENTLRKLEKHAARDGSVFSFASVDAQGLWRAAGV